MSTTVMDNTLTPANNSTRPVVAIFDFDGTLTHTDSFLPFLRWTRRYFYWFWLFSQVLILILYLINLASNHQVKEALISQFFKDWNEEKLKNAATQYAIDELPKLLNPIAINRLQWHQKQGHIVIIVSANLEIYLKPWASQMGISHVLATQLDVYSEKITGKFIGKCCYGEEKVRRLESFLGNLDNYNLHVYGDSRSDWDMLSLADFPYYRIFSGGQGLLIQ